MTGAPLVLTFAAALGCGLAAGVFFAFSSFVMPALGRLAPAQGIAAMQSINVTAVTPAFMTALFGTAALCVAAAVAAVANSDGAGGPLVLAAAALYLVGAIGLTAGYHVPRNDALARLDPGDPAAAADWARYLREWTAANHLRAIASLLAAALLIEAIRVG